MVWTGQSNGKFVFIVCYMFPLRERTSGIPGFVDKPKDTMRALPQQQSVPQFGGGQRMGKCSAVHHHKTCFVFRLREDEPNQAEENISTNQYKETETENRL